MSSNSEEEDDEEYFNRDQDHLNNDNQSLMLSEFSERSTPTETITRDQEKAKLPTYDSKAIFNKFEECADLFEFMTK